MRSIAGFNGSAINGSFASGEPISASALNKLATGVGQAFTMASNDVQFMGNTGGTSYGLGQSYVDIQGTYNEYVPQFSCYIFAESNPADPSGDPLYFVRIAKGNVTTTWSSSFPFTQGTSGGTNSEIPEYIFPAEQVCIFDAAVSPIGSRTSGSDVKSIWFADGGKYELDTEVGSYYVTLSYLDYNDQLDWFADEALIHTNQPWVSIVAATGDSKNAIFSTCTPTSMADYIALGSWDGSTLGPRGSMGLFPTRIGYSMKIIARISWSTTTEAWTVVQEMVGPITFDQNPIVHNIVSDDNKNDGFYASQITSQFASTIFNKTYVDTVFKETSFNDSDILDPATTEWWYDVKTI